MLRSVKVTIAVNIHYASIAIPIVSFVWLHSSDYPPYCAVIIYDPLFIGAYFCH